MNNQDAMRNVYAEVQCRTCKVKKWVRWEVRHAGKDAGDPHYSDARCGPCPIARDLTDFTGVIKVGD